MMGEDRVQDVWAILRHRFGTYSHEKVMAVVPWDDRCVVTTTAGVYILREDDLTGFTAEKIHAR